MDVRQVLVPLDGSELAAAALPTARAVAAAFTAELTAVTVGPDRRERDAYRHKALDSLGAPTTDHPPVEVVVADDPARAIAQRAQELAPSVVCLSTMGWGRVVGSVIGSVTRELLQSCTQPVVAVGPHADRPPALVGRPRRRPSDFPAPLSNPSLLACVNGPESEAVLPHAAHWAEVLGMRLTIVTVAEDLTSPTGELLNGFGPPDPQAYVEQLARDWNDTLPDTTGEVVYDPIGIAAGLNARLKQDAVGMLAVTTHARSGLERLRLGATAADIVRTSPVPTLVVPLIDPPS